MNGLSAKDRCCFLFLKAGSEFVLREMSKCVCWKVASKLDFFKYVYELAQYRPRSKRFSAPGVLFLGF